MMETDLVPVSRCAIFKPAIGRHGIGTDYLRYMIGMLDLPRVG